MLIFSARLSAVLLKDKVPWCVRAFVVASLEQGEPASSSVPMLCVLMGSVPLTPAGCPSCDPPLVPVSTLTKAQIIEER